MLDALTLDQMRVLVAVAEAGSFSAAARRLGRVQSAISQSVQSLESTLGLVLFDRATRTPRLTEAGESIVKESRGVLERVRAMRARASSISEHIEPELALAVDALFPMPLLIASLKALRVEFPNVPATVFTEGVNTSEARLREGAARLAIYPLPAGPPRDLDAEFLTYITLIPVVAASHPLARVEGRISREVLAEEVQLVLTARSPPPYSQPGGGVISDHVWRFADISTRLEFLLEGFGWCNMPLHLVEGHIAAGRLKRLKTDRGHNVELRMYVVREQGRALGRVGAWLVADLRERLKFCPSTHRESGATVGAQPSVLV